ncbi:MAG TPA: flavodoxin family protein [Candidatus Monoglobus merdigallinarum]|uniref:Flavodoxin family protein n=1 Tax=Candidatus Monoglobus merdigallinarum TaxID=2838698 RepID=A0A9D1PR65_9FIRM|nr:flavodoxin family protein [Candidatus Monoglobus merdigallinarum]
MSKKVLILSGSPRRGGNSDLLCDEFARGVMDCGGEAEKIFIRDRKIACCTACYYCRDTGQGCAVKDDMAEILDKMLGADVIVMASPVYFYSIDAQMKAVIDRTLAKWRDIKDKEFYYIMTAAENSKSAMECTLECFRGFAACLDGSREMGVIFGTGVYEPGAVKNTPAWREAYEMGKAVEGGKTV